MSDPTPKQIKNQRLECFAQALARLEDGASIVEVMQDFPEQWQVKFMKDVVRRSPLNVIQKVIVDINAHRDPSDRSLLDACFLHACVCRAKDPEHTSAWLSAMRSWWFTKPAPATTQMRGFMSASENFLNKHFSLHGTHVNPLITKTLVGLVENGRVDTAWTLRQLMAHGDTKHADCLKRLDADLLVASLKEKSSQSFKQLIGKMEHVSDVAWGAIEIQMVNDVKKAYDPPSKKVLAAVLDHMSGWDQQHLLKKLMEVMLNFTNSYGSQGTIEMLAPLLVHRLTPISFAVVTQKVADSRDLSILTASPIREFARALIKNQHSINKNADAITAFHQRYITPLDAAKDAKIIGVWNEIAAIAQRQVLAQEVGVSSVRDPSERTSRTAKKM